MKFKAKRFLIYLIAIVIVSGLIGLGLSNNNHLIFDVLAFTNPPNQFEYTEVLCKIHARGFAVDASGNLIELNKSQFLEQSPFLTLTSIDDPRMVEINEFRNFGYIKCSSVFTNAITIDRSIVEIKIYAQDSQKKLFEVYKDSAFVSSPINLNYDWQEKQIFVFKGINTDIILKQLDNGEYVSEFELQVTGNIKMHITAENGDILNLNIPITGNQISTYFTLQITNTIGSEPEPEPDPDPDPEPNPDERKECSDGSKVPLQDECPSDDDSKQEPIDFVKEFVLCVSQFDTECLNQGKFLIIYAGIVGVGILGIGLRPQRPSGQLSYITQ